MPVDDVQRVLRDVLPRVRDESGIDFTIQEPRIRARPSGLAVEALLSKGKIREQLVKSPAAGRNLLWPFARKARSRRSWSTCRKPRLRWGTVG